MNLKRALAGSATLIVAISLSACGGGAGGAPEDASTEDFCDTFSDMGNLADDATSDDKAEQANDLAESMEEVGTPEDIEEDARSGFEVMVDAFADIDADKVDELEKIGDDDEEAADALGLSDDDFKDFEAFIEYATTTCAEQMMDDAESPETE